MSHHDWRVSVPEARGKVRKPWNRAPQPLSVVPWEGVRRGALAQRAGRIFGRFQILVRREQVTCDFDFSNFSPSKNFSC